MHKKDEMELQVSYKAVKITWFVTIMALVLIGLIDRFNLGQNNIFLVVAGLSVGLYILLERFYLSKVDEHSSFSKYLTIIIALVIIFLLLAWWL